MDHRPCPDRCLAAARLDTSGEVGVYCPATYTKETSMGCSFWIGCRGFRAAAPRDAARRWGVAGAALLMLAVPLRAQQVPPPAVATPPQPSGATPPPAPATEAETTEMEAAPLEEQPPAGSTPAPLGIEWTMGDFTAKLGGYLKVDLIHDFDDIGDTDSFDVGTIPTTGEADNGSNTRLHARQTRLNLDIRGPTSAGDVRLFLEGDFFGDGNSFRMRHAYAQFKEGLFGQTWTNFMDDDAMPETLDFESPSAFPQVRTTQARWTRKLDNGDHFALAIEDPDSEISPPVGVAGTTKEPYPDFTGHWRINNSRGHVQVSGFLGEARFVPDVGKTDDAVLWGGNVAAKLATVDKDNAIIQYTFGDGVGRYRGATVAAANGDGNLEAVGIQAWTLSYQHFWSPEYRSTFGYSWAHADIPSGAVDTLTRRVGYGWVNWIWQFADKAWTGVEYLYGTRTTDDGNNGQAHRIQFSIRFDI